MIINFCHPSVVWTVKFFALSSCQLRQEGCPMRVVIGNSTDIHHNTHKYYRIFRLQEHAGLSRKFRWPFGSKHTRNVVCSEIWILAKAIIIAESLLLPFRNVTTLFSKNIRSCRFCVWFAIFFQMFRWIMLRISGFRSEKITNLKSGVARREANQFESSGKCNYFLRTFSSSSRHLGKNFLKILPFCVLHVAI